MATNNYSGEPNLTGQLVRPRFFPRQLVNATDLNAEQVYFRELMRRHNRYLHGCGVVCGLEVLLTEDDSGQPVVVVTPGHAISPQGDDIHVPELQTIRLADVSQCTGPGQEQRHYLALRYDELPLSPVPTLPGPCMPTAGQQLSRLQAGFKLACLPDLPDGCGEAPPCGDLTCELLRDTPPGQSQCQAAGCPPEDADPWVVLAALALDPNGSVVDVDYGVRRRVLSVQFLVEALRCLLPRVDAILPDAGVQGTRMLAFITGERLADARDVEFEGTGITAQILPEFSQDRWILILMDIASDAPLGPRGFVVTTPRGTVNSTACDVRFTVLPQLVGYGYGYYYGYPVYGAGGGRMEAGIGGHLL